MKTENRISIIGEKRGKEIVPKRDLKGYESYEVFKSSGDIYKLNDFIKILKDEGVAANIFFIVISIIMIIVALGLIILGIFFK